MQDWCQFQAISLYYLISILLRKQFCEENCGVVKSLQLIIVGITVLFKKFESKSICTFWIEKSLNRFSFVYSLYGNILYTMDSQRELDFLEDLTPLSTALVEIPLQLPNVYVNLASDSFVVIYSVICFKKNWDKVLNGIFRYLWNTAFYLLWTLKT